MKLEQSKSWLIKRFIEQGKTIAEIAQEAGCSQATIRRRLKDAGLIK